MRVVSLASGSTGNSTLVRWQSGCLLIDAGISARRIRTAMRAEGVELCDLSAILITHTHTDHISGLEVLLRQRELPVCAQSPAAAQLRRLMPAHRDCFADVPCEGFLLGDAHIRPIPTLHDAAGSCGWRIETPEGVFGLCTDLGVVTDDVLDGLCGVDAALIEANHDRDMLLNGPYPPMLKRRILSEFGHLSNDDAARLAVTLCANGTRRLILGHLSRQNNTPGRAYAAIDSALRAALPEALLPRLAVAPEAEALALEVEEPCAL